jgi:hypothetical protein
MLDVQLGGFGGVVGGVMQVALRRVRVVRGGLVVPRFMVPSGFAMVLGGLLVVFRCLEVMLCCLF